MRGKEDRSKVKTVIKTSLRRGGIEPEGIKNEMAALINKQKIAL
jgi:hypothetical protein